MSLQEFLDVKFRSILGEALKETRHDLRNEVTVLAAKVEAASITNAAAHASNSVKLDNLTAEVKELGKMEPRLSAVEAHQESESAVAVAVDKMRDWNLRLVVAVVGVGGALAVLH